MTRKSALLLLLLPTLIFAGFSGRCPVCVEKGLRSTVRPGHTSCTAMNCIWWYDEDGTIQGNQNCNTCTSWYSCSLGHTFYCENGDCKPMKTSEDPPPKPAKELTARNGSLVAVDESVGESIEGLTIVSGPTLTVDDLLGRILSLEKRISELEKEDSITGTTDDVVLGGRGIAAEDVEDNAGKYVVVYTPEPTSEQLNVDVPNFPKPEGLVALERIEERLAALEEKIAELERLLESLR